MKNPILKWGIVCLFLTTAFYSCEKIESHSDEENQTENIDKRQRFSNATPGVYICDVEDITVLVEDCFDAQYVQAIDDAIDMFNDVPLSRVNFRVVDNLPADIVLDCFEQNCSNGNILGGEAGDFFDTNMTTNTITINTSLDEIQECCCDDDFGGCELAGLIAHEMAHAIGIQHTNQGFGSYMPGTPTVDNQSVFNGASLCESSCVLSAGDIKALQLAYPTGIMKATISGLCCLPKPNLFNDDCQIYQTTASVITGDIVSHAWFISPMTGVTIYSNSQTATIFRFSFDDTVVNGDDFVVGVDLVVDFCDEQLDAEATQIVEVYSCEGEEGGDQ